jgi:hypothetical protein
MATYTWEEIEAMAEREGVAPIEIIDQLVIENSYQLN